jgi:hypothetical protein
MYQAYGLLQAGSDFTLDAAVPRLKAKFPQMNVTHQGGRVTVSSSDWEIHLWMNNDPSVLAESADIAEKIAGDEDGTYIANCASRVEVASDISDPFMEHFGDFQAIIDVLQSFKGVIAVDPREPCLM